MGRVKILGNLEAIATAKLANGGSLKRKASDYDDFWAFVDGTVRKGMQTREKSASSLQSTPNGLVANLFGPMEGKRHVSAVLARSGLLPLLITC